jgi:NAD(P)-dependent dehydrogenase (short-subunit alcohol dehydrogenase family)
MPAVELLRPGLLDEVSVLVAGAAPPARLGDAVGKACAGLGACVRTCEPDAAEEATLDEMLAAAVAEMGGLDLLAVDCEALFAKGGLSSCLDAVWNVTRAVVNVAFLTDKPSLRRIVYLAPGVPGQHAGAACAGLENLARTLSIEWARHGITPVTIAPGTGTPEQAAALVTYLASPAGAYFSGCLLDLRGIAGA